MDEGTEPRKEPIRSGTVFDHSKVDPKQGWHGATWDYLEIEALPELTDETFNYIMKRLEEGERNTMDEQVLQLQRETRSSIEVTRNAKGEYQWVIKIYFDAGEYAEVAAAMTTIRNTDEALRAGYLR